jgi:hypothetical protein
MAAAKKSDAPAQAQPGFTIRKRDRHWTVIDPAGALVCLTVYKRGAVEVVRRLSK